MSWYDDYVVNPLKKVPIVGGLLPGGNPTQDTTDVRNIGAGQPGVNKNGGMDLSQVNLPYFQQDRDSISNTMNGQSPFASQSWQGLISQLQDQSMGRGPSLAQAQYNQGINTAQNSVAALASGSGGPGSVHDAMSQMGNIGANAAGGLATAGIQERLGAQGQLAGALNARDQINSGAYMNLLAQKLGLSQGQLRALQGNQAFITEQNKTNQANEASKYAALASIIGSFAGGGEGGGKPPAGAAMMAGG